MKRSETKLIHITHAMPVETLNDLALTATGGVGYWAVQMRSPTSDANLGIWSQFEEDTGEPYGDPFTLDADLIAKGIEACSKARPDIWHRFATDVIDGSADIDACDTIVQFGVFGELVYG